MPYALVEMLNAGEMSARITLRQTAHDPNDEPIPGDVIAEDVPAQKRALRGRELVESGRDVSENWVEFRIRYRAGLDSATQITDADGVVYDVEGVPADPTGNKRVIVISCKVVR
jgi:SPP1 family predicted phage head-tail adaptor